MTTPTKSLPQAPELEQSPKRRSAIVPTLIVLLCALLLLGGSAVGYVSTCANNAQTSANTAFGYGILIGGAAFCAAALWLFLIFVWYLIKG
jgi:hypothetical protein